MPNVARTTVAIELAAIEPSEERTESGLAPKCPLKVPLAGGNASGPLWMQGGTNRIVPH